MHDHTELFIVLNGSAVHRVDGQENFVRAGDVYVLRSGSTHGYSHVSELMLYNIGFHPGLPLALGDEIRGLDGFQRLFMLAPHPGDAAKRRSLMSRLQLTMLGLRQAETIAESIREACDGRYEGHESLARARFIELVVFLSRAYTEHVSSTTDGLLRLARAASYVETHFTEPGRVGVDELAAQAGLSVAHFARLFREHYQVSPGAYVQLLRVQHAAHQLASTQRTVTEIAFSSGFGDSNYFSRQFRRFMGITPREYRKQQQQPPREPEVI